MSREFNIFEAGLQGISLVEAGAGTGKTFNIASLYVRLILEKELLPPNILVLTFTEAATSELKSRLRKRIIQSIEVLEGGEPADEFLTSLRERYSPEKTGILKKALYTFDEARVSTIHGFCQRLLKERSLEFGVNPGFEILTDERELLQDIVDKYWRSFFRPVDDPFQSSLQYHLFEHGYDPDKLFRDIKEIRKGTPDLIEPAVVPISDFEQIYKEFLEIRKRAFIIINEEKELLEQTFNGDALNKNEYNDYKFLYLKETIQWLNSEPVSLKEYHKLKLFSSEKLKAKKNYTIPDFKTTEVIDELRDVLSEFSLLLPSLLNEAFQRITENYEKTKHDRQLLSYDDLLLKVEKGIQTPELSASIKKELPVALIDEFQDTDPVQYSIFSTIYKDSEESCFFMIGDPKQAIYAFRGGDIHTYLKAKKDADPGQVYSLKNNYRSNPDMIRSVNEIFNIQPHSFRLEGLDFEDASFPASEDPTAKRLTKEGKGIVPFQFIELETDATRKTDYIPELCDSVASEIVLLLQENYSIDQIRVSPKDIAVLVRTRDQASKIQDALRQRGIRSVLNSRESVFRTIEAQELFLVLSAIHAPSFEALVRAAMSTRLLGYKASDMISLQKDANEWEKILLRFHGLNKLWNNSGISSALDQLILDFDVELNLASWFDAERRITNLQHISELLKKEERDKNLLPIGILNYMRARIDDEDDPKDEEIVRLESDAELVQIVTMHSSKGLQYPIVFCPFLFEGVNVNDSGYTSNIFRFRREGTEVLDLGTSEGTRRINKDFYFEEQLQERIRLTYVAMTRAESACFVHLIDSRSLNKSSLSALVTGMEHDLMPAVRELSTHSDVIDFRKAIHNEQIYTDPTTKDENIYHLKTFKRKDLSIYPRITSFSALSDSLKNHDEQYVYQGFDYDALPVKDERETTELSIFSLTKGAATGTLVHNIFESISFDKPDGFKDSITEQLLIHGFDEKWATVLLQLIQDSVDHPLKDELKLSSIPDDKRLVEMEFNLPVKGINSSEIVKIIRNEDHSSEKPNIHGFMKGFIDLVFVHNGQYFILDYKTNHLGDSFEDYSQERIATEIKEAGYDLQYHIYATSLHRYLKQQMPGYDYENHFGGVIYLFVRGIQSGKEGSGVFFDRPDHSVISRLDGYFKNGVSDD